MSLQATEATVVTLGSDKSILRYSLVLFVRTIYLQKPFISLVGFRLQHILMFAVEMSVEQSDMA